MPRYKDEPPAVRVYTVCDESRFLSVLVFCSSFYKFVQCFICIIICGRYLIVRNVPSLGCGDELLKLFSSYGDVEE